VSDTRHTFAKKCRCYINKIIIIENRFSAFITSVGRVSAVSCCTSETSPELSLPFTDFCELLGEGALFHGGISALLPELSNDCLDSCVFFFVGRGRGVLFTVDLDPLATALFLVRKKGSLPGAETLEVILVFSDDLASKPTRIIINKNRIYYISKDGKRR
jgi:hypothetical protein